jgi:hypothetical protein
MARKLKNSFAIHEFVSMAIWCPTNGNDLNFLESEGRYPQYFPWFLLFAFAFSF